MEKVKFVTICEETAGKAMIEALKTAKPKLKGLSNEELAKSLGLSEFQFEHLTTKALGRAVSEHAERKMQDVLHNGDSIEVPNQFNVFVHESETRKNPDDSPVKKLSVRTRKMMKESLNN